MQLKTIISSISAAALMAGMGVAGANQRPPQTSSPSYGHTQYPSDQRHSSAHQDTATAVANEAAAVLRENTGTMHTQQPGQTGQYPATTAGSQRIPQQVVDSARCIAVFPNVSQAGSSGTAMSGAMSTSGSAGTMTAATENTGLASCRGDNGSWSVAPVVVKLSSAHVQPETTTQAGMQSKSGERSATTTSGTATAQTTGNAVVLLFTSDDAADELQDGDVELGDDVDVSPGPTGSAGTAETSSEQVVAYQSTPQSSLSGAAIHGGKISFDEEVNKQTYGEDVDPEDLLQNKGESEHTQHATKLIAFNQALNRFAPPAAYRSAQARGGL